MRPTTSVRESPQKNLPPRNTPDSFCRCFTRQNPSLCCMGGIFLLRETHLENLISRPNVIPTFRQRRCTNRGRNFVRSKRRSTYTSSGTLYLFLRLNNSETITRKRVLSAAVEGKNRPVATNFQFLKMFCPSGTSLLKLLRVFQVILLGRACPKPCSWFAPDGANSNGVSCLHNFTEELSNRQEVQ